VVDPILAVPDNIRADGRIEIPEADNGRRNAELVVTDRPLGSGACAIRSRLYPTIRQQHERVEIGNDDRGRADQICVNTTVYGDRRRRASGRKDGDIISGSGHVKNLLMPESDDSADIAHRIDDGDLNRQENRDFLHRSVAEWYEKRLATDGRNGDRRCSSREVEEQDAAARRRIERDRRSERRVHRRMRTWIIEFARHSISLAA
jgi:hypothetical protein